MKSLFLPLKNLPPALQVLFRPMLLISVALHGLLLSLPMLPESKSKPPAPKKEEKVKITRLVAPPTQPSPKPSPKISKPTPKPTPKQVVPPPQQRVAPPPLAPIPKPTPTPTPQPPEPSPQQQQQPEPTPQKQQQPEPSPQQQQQPEPTPQKQQQPPEPPPQKQQPQDNSAAGAAAGKGLINELRSRVFKDLVENSTNEQAAIEQVLDSLPIEDVNPDKQPYFFSGNQLKQGAIGSLGIAQRNPSRAYDQYIEPILKNELGFNIEPQNDEYGGADLYKARNNEGVEFYMSLVPFSAFNTQTLVVIWAKDPRVQ